jgi:tetraacyldisaccharide 4'-kinase
MVYSPQKMNRVLLPLALAYQLGSRLRNFFFDHGFRKTIRASIPVISVGNIAFGGSEKTPLVIHLLDFLLKHGFKPAMVTRGYKGKWEKSGGVLSDGQNLSGTWEYSGDEPFLVARKLPQAGIYVGRNRWESCEKAKLAGFDLIILDDGFQHRQLHRDLDIVLFDPDETMALREPISSLKRANIILLKRNTHSHSKERIRRYSSHTKIFSYSIVNNGFFSYPDDTPIQREYLKKKRLLVVCGIARPKRFLSQLEEEGLKPLLALTFPDHHSYPVSTRNKIINTFKKIKADVIITTEKDVFKLNSLKKAGEISVYCSKIDLQVEEKFYPEVLSLQKDG